MDLKRLIQHPEYMDKETLYDLRSLIALHPYYQTARILLLQNLYILHDPSFDEELRRTAICISDRRVIFNMIEAAHYKYRNEQRFEAKAKEDEKDNGDRTTTLIDSFLGSIPKNSDSESPKEKRKPTLADAAIDYVSYLLEIEDEDNKQETVAENDVKAIAADCSNGDRTTDLINSFIEDGGFNLKEETNLSEGYQTYDLPTSDNTTQKEAEKQDEDRDGDECFFTETLARIYIKQGRYEKALEIIKRLNLNIPKKNAYFADQIRFLEKLIINNKNKK
ncbi:tetratricopeptide repeat protein [Prevotella sp.]|uniref:tetratricopeptide repeat protein n=1 Tax=Prevotella sp. TaxID=59823 RepID=UPI002649DB84|nr:tetratricopeptide repeat protein [Prevotella sp.]MDN5554516.1 tetratricopeptide repeat protein [Prevotella sp.]